MTKYADIQPWKPTLAFLIDSLSIVTLKSIILGATHPDKKVAYEQEAAELMKAIDLIAPHHTPLEFGMMVRAVQVNMLANRLIWENETLVRQGKGKQDKRLPLTHSINGIRMRSCNAIASEIGGRKDLNLDRTNEDICQRFGFDFGGLFDQ